MLKCLKTGVFSFRDKLFIIKVLQYSKADKIIWALTPTSNVLKGLTGFLKKLYLDKSFSIFATNMANIENNTIHIVTKVRPHKNYWTEQGGT